MEERKGTIGEYEKIFGELKKPINLFERDEDYSTLRHQITQQPVGTYQKGKLPFENIKLIPYTDFVLMHTIDLLEKSNFHIFYLTHSNHGTESFCKAVGVYYKSSQIFYILKYSYVASHNGFSPFDTDLQKLRQKALRAKVSKKGKVWCLSGDIACANPSMAATIVLGRRAYIEEWKDKEGKGILHYYPELISKSRALRTDLPLTPKTKKNEAKDISVNAKQLFYIKEPGICYASGYFDSQNHNFYILKDSLVALNSEKAYSFTNSGKARVLFLDKVCKKEGHFYRVIKDAKCRSASAAACYALGKAATFTCWKDMKGYSLKDCFPDIDFQENPELFANVSLRVPSSNVIDPRQHPFYIKGNKYSATGYYDPKNNRIILKEGSVLSLEVSKMFQYTALEFQRRRFLVARCKKIDTGYMVKEDTLIDNPNMAASFIIGENADGMTEWRDQDGKTIKEIFNLTQ